MTDKTSISRIEFIKYYGDEFDKLFIFNEDGDCVIKEYANWDFIVFQCMPLPGWSADAETFKQFFDFISVVTRPKQFVLVEVESIERFTEVRVVLADRIEVEKLWFQSRLPHFRTACFDETGLWCALFDNLTDNVNVYRKKNIGKGQ